MPISFPIAQSTVSKRVLPKHLLPMTPRAAWDGWFAIAIFPPDSPIRWLKAHLFHRACGPGMHPVASFEGMDAHSEMLLTWAGEKDVQIRQNDIDASALKHAENPLCVELPERFSLRGDHPDYSMEFSLSDQARAEFHFQAHWPIWWSKWGRLLQYAGRHCGVDVKFDVDGKPMKLRGMGVMEHVCGLALPFDITKVSPIHFHWDVLCFDPAGAPAESAAGLSIGRNGKTLVELRAAACFPGGSARAVRGLRVRYLEIAMKSTDQGDIAVPLRWEGAMRGRNGLFRYEAGAATPPAALIPGGAMMGFDFEGELTRPDGSTLPLTGVGFNEYGDFAGQLIHIKN